MLHYRKQLGKEKEMEKKSKQDRVLKYLKTHKTGITQAQAIDKFKAYRLSSIVFKLRRRGHEIETIHETSKDANGFTSNYARYVLHEG